MILDFLAGPARVSRWRRVRVGATTPQANACKAEQRPRARCQRLNRVGSVLTRWVDLIEAKKFNVHTQSLIKSSGQLRNLG